MDGAYWHGHPKHFTFGKFAARTILEAHFAAREIRDAIGQREFACSVRAFRRAAQHGFHAGQQFAHAERFHHVIIRTQPQAVHAVRLLAARGEDDDGQRGAHLARGLQDVEAARAGQNQIQHQQVNRRARRLAHPFRAGGAGHRVIAGKAQRIDDALANRRVVFHHENALGVHECLAPTIAAERAAGVKRS